MRGEYLVGLLIVDPNRARSRRISEAFTRQWGGSQPKLAKNASEARDRLERHRPRCVLAHASLPSHEMRDLAQACEEDTRFFLLQNPEEVPWPLSSTGCDVLTDEAEALPVQVELALFTSRLSEFDLSEFAKSPAGDRGGDDEGGGSGTEPEQGCDGPWRSGSDAAGTLPEWEIQRRLLEQLPVACCVYRDRGQLVYVNPAWVGGAEQPALGESHLDESPYLLALELGSAEVDLENGTRLLFERFDLPATPYQAVSAQIAPVSKEGSCGGGGGGSTETVPVPETKPPAPRGANGWDSIAGGASSEERLPQLSGWLDRAGNPMWGGTRRVLFVDDEESLLRLARAQLKRLGYAAITCSSAEEALEQLDREHFDVVVADERLPKHSGRELAACLSDRDGGPPVVLASVCTTPFPEDSGPGISAVLEKPYDLEALARTLVRVLTIPAPV